MEYIRSVRDMILEMDNPSRSKIRWYWYNCCALSHVVGFVAADAIVVFIMKTIFAIYFLSTVAGAASPTNQYV